MSENFYIILIASLSVTIGVGILFLLYKYLLARLNKNEGSTKPYVILKPIRKIEEGIQIMIIVPETLNVDLNIVSSDGNIIQTLCDKELKKGNHKFECKLPDDKSVKLFCQLMTKYQKTEKIIDL